MIQSSLLQCITLFHMITQIYRQGILFKNYKHSLKHNRVRNILKFKNHFSQQPMRITKLDPYTVDDPRVKNRVTSTSQDKGNTLIARKKLQIVGIQTHQLQNKMQDEGQSGNGKYENGQGYGDGNSNSKKIIGGEFIGKDAFIDFLENQMRNQQKQIPHTAKNKVKLPQIGSNKQNVNCNTLIEDEALLNFQHDVQKIQSVKNTALTAQKQTSKPFSKDNPIFINIKAVQPMQKAVSKKKDHSLRDLRILRKQRQQQNQDCIIQKSQQVQRNSNSRSRTGITKKVYLQNGNIRESVTLKLTTAQKRRSQRSSLQKISDKGGVRDKKAFSINPGKKKYATTYQQFCLFVSSLNKIRLSQAPIVLYKAFVGKGNNSILIKNVIKNRFWWNIVGEKTSNQEVNFVWSQQRDNQFIVDLPCTTKIDSKQTQTVQSVKKLRYHLQAKEEKQQHVIREFTRYGFARLLSEKESREGSYTPLYAQTLAQESLPQPMDPQKLRIHNHFESNWNLTNKKALFYNLKAYYELIKDDPFVYIPLTFHVKEPGDKAWDEFKSVYDEKIKQRLVETESKDKKKKNQSKKQKPTLPLWIIKPGENSNQGCGIQVSDSLQQIQQIVKQKTQNGKNRSSIIQKYLMPFLYNKRKFDIRCYMLTTSIKGIVKGYWYQEGYIRTSSKQFTTKNLKNRMIHLTNDAVQKKSEDYGKYENGNKISFGDFQKYLDNLPGGEKQKKLNFYKTVYPKMMRLAKDALTATNLVLDAKNRQFSFQVFGLDFMIDEEFQTWLIEVNNNPCLELSSPLLARIIPNMIENAMKIAIDPIFPPPLNIPKSKTLQSDLFQTNKFTLVFNSCDIEEGFQRGINENKINLDKIVEGEDEDDELMDDEEEGDGEGETCVVVREEKVEKEQVNEVQEKQKIMNESSQRETDMTQSQQL